MKALIVLAALLMVPIVMHFQQKAVQQSSRDEASQQVARVLLEHDVIAPAVAVNFLDVTIGGYVGSEEKSAEISREINALRGLRLADNQLKVEGWIRLGRDGKGRAFAQGTVAPNWVQEGLKGAQELDLSELQTKPSIVMSGPHPAAWGVFCDAFLAQPGAREFLFQGTHLILSGEATPSLARDFADTAEKVVPGVEREERYETFPSSWHYPSRVIESSASGEALRSLRRTLGESLVAIESEQGAGELSSSTGRQLDELAALLIENQPGNTFLLGGHPDEQGAELAQKRASVVEKALLDRGVPPEILQTVSYEMTEDRGEVRGRVELLVR